MTRTRRSSTLLGRPITAALAAVYLAVVPLSALAEPAPQPVRHVDHISSETEGACPPAHNDFHCQFCRLLNAVELAAADGAGLASAATLAAAATPAMASIAAGDDVFSPLQPRAPPFI